MKLCPSRRHAAWLLLLAAPLSAGAARSRETGLVPGLGARLQQVRELIETEADQDKKVSDRMACWCKSNLEEDRRYAEELGQQADRLSHEVQAKTAENARLTAELEQHKAELADSEESLSKAAAMREKAASKYTAEHQLTTQSIKQLDGALESLRTSHGHELSAVQQMRRLLASHGAAKTGALLQMRRRLDAASSPQEVYGVLKQMRQTFAANLEDMRQDESLMKTRHDDLSRAKAQMIESIKRQMAAKQQRVAEGSLHASRQKEVMDRTGKLLEATRVLVSAMDRACDDSGRASQARLQERQQALVALSAAQAELAGAQLLATASARGRAAGSGPEDLCLLAAGLPEPQWRERAKAACAAARAGRVQDAAEAAEALGEDVKEAMRVASSDAEQCERAHKEALAEHARAAEEAEVRANVIDGTKQGADSQIEELNAQAVACQKAKTELSEIGATSRSLLQGIRADAGRIATLVRTSISSAPAAAVAKLNEVAASMQKLARAAAPLGETGGARGQELSRALDDSMRAASRVLVPLRLIRADAEEAAVSVHEAQARRAHAAAGGPGCDSAALAAKVRQLQGHAKRLGDASVTLAWGSLR